MEIRLFIIAILATLIGATFSGTALADGPLKLRPGMMGVADQEKRERIGEDKIMAFEIHAASLGKETRR